VRHRAEGGEGVTREQSWDVRGDTLAILRHVSAAGYPSQRCRTCVLLTIVSFLCATSVIAQRSTTTPTATTSPADSPAVEAQRVLGRARAGDRTAIPTLLLWLGAEQDGLRLDSTSARLRAALQGVVALRAREALPWLAAIAVAPAHEASPNFEALDAMFAIDPDAAKTFALDHLRQNPLLPGALAADPLIVYAAALLADAGEDAGLRRLRYACACGRRGRRGCSRERRSSTARRTTCRPCAGPR
jgi:hypothetical protein